jgi:RNA polymerase sigma-70 factor (ECF subfamily)
MTNLNGIIQQAQRGNREAIAQLYQTYAQKIFRYIVYRVVSNDDAEDLTAEVFVKMVEGLPTYRITGAPFEAWLYRIAAARVIDYRRRINRRPQTQLSESYSTNEPSPEEHITSQQEIDHLRTALSALSDEQQHILILRFIERKSHQEVADIIGKSVSAVKSIQHRALIQLATRLGSETKVRHYLRGSYDE